MFGLTEGAARIFHDSSLLFSPRTSHLMFGESPSIRERERECKWRINKKKPKEPLCHGRDWTLQPQSPEPSAPSTIPWCSAPKNDRLELQGVQSWKPHIEKRIHLFEQSKGCAILVNQTSVMLAGCCCCGSLTNSTLIFPPAFICQKALNKCFNKICINSNFCEYDRVWKILSPLVYNMSVEKNEL